MDESNDWKTAAAATLRSLEEVFRPLAADLPPGLEPATTFRADPEENQ